MNSKNKMLLSSIASIALCSSIAVGGTFALFTSEQKVNVAVTAGKVKVTAEILEESLKTSSSLSTFTYEAKEENNYTANFENGGKATFSNADGVQVLTLANVTPGDKAEFQLKATNESNVSIQYRFTWTVDGKLSEVLEATVQEENAEAVKLTTNKTEWAKWEDADNVKTFNLAVYLPETVDNTYQEQKASISFLFEAVQGNVEMPDEWNGTTDTTWYNDEDTTFTLSTAEELVGLAELANNGNTFSGKTIELESNMDLDGKQWTPINKFAGKLFGNDHLISNFSVDATAAHGGFINTLEWGTVEDLTLTDINATVGDYRFGALARNINQSNIENVTVKNVNVTTTAPSAFVAGLFGHGTVNSNMEVNNCTVENLTVNAEAGASLIGGITTFVQKNGTEAEGTNIFDNINVKNFKVIVKDTDGVCGVGGLVGQTQSVWQNPRFNNCSVTDLDVTAMGQVDVGGFMCYPGSVTFAENCTTEGNIDVSGVTSADCYAGGFFGDYGWGDNIGKGDHKVTSCSANVNIITKYASAGGFVGSGTNSEGRNKNITLTNCEAKGTVTCVEGGTANIGGFAGQTDRGIYINCTVAQEPFIGKVLDGYTLNDDGNGTLTVTK